jgi:hypothetical protein
VIATVGSEAEREFIDAAAFYAQEGGHELGLTFILIIREVIVV